MRGYFGIGVEGISKPQNMGNLVRTAHGFGAGFVFTIGAHYRVTDARMDTSRSIDRLPFYEFDDGDQMVLPRGCALIGVELTEDAVDLPSFRHPLRAAYVLGREKGSISDALQARCDHIVKIPTQFCVNVSVAGAIVMYDRIRSLGPFPPKPMRPGGPVEPWDLGGGRAHQVGPDSWPAHEIEDDA